MKIKELLSDESKWTIKTYARDKDGNLVAPESEKACKFCLSGAIRRCYGDNQVEARSKLHIAIHEITGQHSSLPRFNDRSDFQTIRQVLELADV